MPSKENSGITAKNIIFLSLAILVLFGLVAGIWIFIKYTNGGTEDFKTFTVELDGDLIVAERSERTLSAGKHTVKTGYIFDEMMEGGESFYAEIVPTPNSSFDYTVDGNVYAWKGIDGLEKAFDLQLTANGFSFTVPNNLKTVLTKIYPNSEITSPTAKELKDLHPFELVISSYNRKIVYTIAFNILHAVDDVELNPEGIKF